MTDLIRTLVAQITQQMDTLTRDLEGREEILTWIRDEYANYMVISSDAYIDTIKTFQVQHPEAPMTRVLTMLLEHLGKYGSTQAIFRAASALLSPP